jgi:hypothetical protein
VLVQQQAAYSYLQRAASFHVAFKLAAFLPAGVAASISYRTTRADRHVYSHLLRIITISIHFFNAALLVDAVSANRQPTLTKIVKQQGQKASNEKTNNNYSYKLKVRCQLATLLLQFTCII